MKMTQETVQTSLRETRLDHAALTSRQDLSYARLISQTTARTERAASVSVS